MRRSSPVYRALALLMLALLVVGCGSRYAIRGRVVRGPIAMVQVVDVDDPRLKEPNATGGGAVVTGIFEPNTPSETRALGRHITDGQGWFSIPLDAFGAGFLEYEAQLIARRDSNQGAMAVVALPRRGERVLITLPLGRDTLAVPESVLDQTLRDAKPYLEQNR